MTSKFFLRSFIIFTLFSSLIACSGQPVSPNQTRLNAKNNECVVLVHGLWRSGFSMRSIAADLEEYGYQTVRIDYPSTEMEIPELAQQYLPKGIESCKQTGAKKIHLVTHSMGGIVARQYLQSNSLPQGSKVVMLSPPNHGSNLSETFGESWWYQWVAGPAAVSLTQKENGIINQLHTIHEPVGVIAAYREWSLWPESWLPKPNDGTVSVESMRLQEMDDFILINSGHATMRYNDEIHQQIRQFLIMGVFQHPHVAEM
jgi:triacylglycerol lipase